MNRKPVWYLQTDPRWKNLRFPCNGGTMSVGGGGCGPTSAAMLIETLTGKQYLPPEALKWACQRGYVTSGQGTDYAYFKPQFAAYDIRADMLTWTPCMSAASAVRSRVEDMLRGGYYFIALMKKGLWTSGGHYVVVWWADDRVRINDPASTAEARLNGDPTAFWSTAKYFWWVDARDFNKLKNEEEDEDVKRYQTLDEILEHAKWAYPTIKKLVERKVLGGTGSGLDVSEDMLRTFVVNDRAGLYDR